MNSAFLVKLDTLITETENMAAIAILDSVGKQGKYLAHVAALMQEVIPEVVKYCYEIDPEDKSGNAAYWVNQTARIVDSIGTKDGFLLADIFYHETSKNLRIFKNIYLESAGKS